MSLDRPRWTIVAAALTACVSAAATPRATDVSVRVWVQGSGTSFRHRVYVTNKSTTRSVETVAIGLNPGLREEPRLTSGPTGWQARLVKRAEGVWAVEFSCSGRTLFPEPGGAETSPPSAISVPCGIVARQTLAFDVVLAYNSPSLEIGPVGIVYSDGQEALAAP